MLVVFDTKFPIPNQIVVRERIQDFYYQYMTVFLKILTFSFGFCIPVLPRLFNSIYTENHGIDGIENRIWLIRNKSSMLYLSSSRLFWYMFEYALARALADSTDLLTY